MKTSRWLIVLALSLAGAACAPDDPLGPALDALDTLEETDVRSAPSLEAEQSRMTVRVPFRATAEGIGTDPEPGPPCDEGFAPTGNVAHGTGTHLGRFTSVHRQCVNFQTLEFRDGTVTFHAANGDQLHATFQGFLSPTGEEGVLSFENDAHPAGGTGRFDGADGLLKARGLVDVVNNAFEIDVEGILVLQR